MKILLDECMPKKLRDFFTGHEVFTVTQMKWNGLRNGRLIRQAIGEGFDLLITIDKGLRFQQNIKGNDMIVVVFDSSSSKAEHLQKFIPLFNKQLPEFKKQNVYLIEL
jgi:hypothetical protein